MHLHRARSEIPIRVLIPPAPSRNFRCSFGEFMNCRRLSVVTSELFSEVADGVAENYFWTQSSFTIAAIGDGGDTALTYDIAKFPDLPKGLK